MTISIEADLVEFIKHNIRNWVGKNFDASEVEEPSWNIDDLSFYLAKAINKRDKTLRSMTPIEVDALIKDMGDTKRKELMDKIFNKLERLGASLTSITYSKETFFEPIKGENSGIRAVVKADMSNDTYAIRGFNRWLERQVEGHGSMLSYNIKAGDSYNPFNPVW